MAPRVFPEWISFDLNPTPLVENPESFYRSEVGFLDWFIFFHVEKNEPKEDACVPRILRVTKPDNEAAPHAGSGVVTLDRVLTIRRLLRVSLCAAPYLTA